MRLPVAFPLLPLSMLFMIPFVVWNHFPPVMSFYAEWWAGILSVLAILSIVGSWGWRRPPESGYGLLGLVLLLAIQIALGLVADLPLAIVAMLYLLGGVALIAAVRQVAYRVGGEALVVTLAWALIVGGVLSALFAFHQVWPISSLLAGVVTAKGPNGATGNLGQANHLATYLGIGLVSVSYLLLKRKLGVVLALVLGGWLVVALSLTGSRSGWLYLLALVVLSVGWLNRRRSPEAKMLCLVAFAYVAWFIFLQWFLSDLARLVTASQRLAGEGGGLEIRWIYWRHAWEMFLANPMLGVGYQNFAWENFALLANDMEAGKVLPASLQLSTVNNAHNIFMHALAEFGLLGLLSVCLLVYWIIRQMIKSWNPERWWAWGVFSILGIHSLLEFPLWYGYWWAIFVVVLGVVEGPLLDEKAEWRSGLGLAVTLIVLAALAVVGSLGVKYPVLERVFAYGPERNPDYTSSHLQEDFAALQGAWFLDPWIAFAYSAVPIEADQPQAWPLQLHFNTVSARHWPNRGLLYRQVLLLGLNGEIDKAAALLRKVGTVHPDRLPIFLRQLEPFSTVNVGARQLHNQVRSMIREGS